MKRYITYILLLLVILPSSGRASTKEETEKAKSTFTTLDWTELQIDSMLPIYTEVVPLETDYRFYDYVVLLEYPEYGSLNKAEEKIVEQFKERVGETIKVETHVGVDRRQGFLDISFIPIIRRDGAYKKLLSCRITIQANPKASVPRKVPSSSSRYADHSVLSSGTWVKISITEDGIYSLTRSSLRRMGFSNPDKVHLYGYGGYRQNELIDADKDFDDLEEIPLYKQGDNLLFWGNGLTYWNGNTRVVNHYANQACYFLTEGNSNTIIEAIAQSDGTADTIYTTFPSHVLYEKDEYAWYWGGRNLYENVNYGSSNSHTYKLTTSNSAGNELLTVSFSAGASKETILQTNVNGADMKETMSMPALSKYTYATLASRTFDVSKLADGNSWTVRLTSTSGNDARLDYLALHYDRKIVPTNEEGFVAFSQTGNAISEFDIICDPNNVQVMRVGQRNDPAVLIKGTAKDGNILSITVDDPTRRYVAFDTTHNFPEPTYVGTIENQDLHSLDSLDMVIIIPTSGKMKQQAQRLAAAHLYYDSLRVGIVRADQIYNEFSSGTPDATAYRRLMKMLYDRAETETDAPRYLLLMGDAAWDNRMVSTAWRSYKPDDYLLCYESENSYSDTRCYVMEDYFGLLDDGEGGKLLRDKTDLGVGRFPVTSASEAKIIVDKTINYMSRQNAGSWKNVVCMMGDDGDENEHMKYCDDVAKRIKSNNPEIEIRKVMWDAYTRVSTARSNTYPEVEALLAKQMKEGALVMNYTGHASTYTLSHEFVLNLEDFEAFKSSNLPLWVTAACDVMPFDGQSANIGETAVLNPGGSAVAFYGTTRTVYANQNLTMNRFFMKYLFGVDDHGVRYRLGDAIRLAKRDIITDGFESGFEENKLHYALLGDPALVMGAPLQRVVLDSINGQVVSSENPIGLKAGSKVNMSGHIEDNEGNVLPDFQGVLSARVYDSEETVTCKNNAKASTPFTFLSREDVLYNAQDSILDGKFELAFTVPVDINYSDERGRIVFYAINDAKTVEANGYSEDFNLGGVSDELDTDTISPFIYAYLNNEDFQDGDEVNSEPYFVALLQDESGINVSGNGIGHDLILCVDGRADRTYNLNDNYVVDFGNPTRGVVTYTIPTLEAGPHSLTFRAWDVLNNTSSISMNFVVNPGMKPELLQLTANPNPAVTNTNFLITYDRPGSECTFTIDVFDFMGRKLWTQSETGNSSGLYVIPWNLTTGSGGRVGTGIYLYRCTLQCGESKEVSKTQKIIVLNNK
ncbi:MAG: type IX secretion system sortase PorU [Bacteroidaceae bacterium]|nr:type IX secretion system sortase PorU [Bacteroidaceae bacterium]